MIRMVGGGSFNYKKVWTEIRNAEIRSLTHAAGAMRLAARKSIITTPRVNPAAAGAPPHTRKGKLRRAILYSVLEEGGESVAYIGPAFNLIGLIGKVHEFGVPSEGKDYPKRPFMGPALKLVENRLPEFFSGSVRSS